MKQTKNNNVGSSKRLIQTGLICLALAPLTLSAPAQQLAPATSTPQNPPAAVPFVEYGSPKPQNSASTAITVHGHWIMDVVNRDGSIAQHRDFENALVPGGGATVLAGLLLGTLAPQTFDVVLKGTGKTALLYLDGQSCPQGLANYQGDCSATLTQNRGPGGTSVVLKSTYTPAADLTVTTVSTNIGTCPTVTPPNTVSPAVCQATTTGPIPGAGGAYVGIYNFTAATIPDLVVTAGQSLNVTVTISFL